MKVLDVTSPQVGCYKAGVSRWIDGRELCVDAL